MNNLPTQVWFAWLFAMWLVIGGVRDYISQKSPRYRNKHTLVLALTAAIELILLGYLLFQSFMLLAFVLLVIFGLTWWRWMQEACRGSNVDE